MDFNFNEKYNKLGLDLGASALGFANLRSLPIEERLGYNSAISVVVRLSTGILSQIKKEPTITYFSHYRSVNRYIDHLTLRLMMSLEEDGYPSIAIPASQSDPQKYYGAVFSHKTAATLSGLGWIGKNALFIHSEYGPAVRLGTILTNAPFSTWEGVLESQCGGCQRCQKACPALAIEGKLWEPGMKREMLLDARSCSDYMKEAYQHIGRGVVCGLCIVNCPYFE